MSSPFSGAQLPLTAFFNPRSAQESKGKSAKPKVAARRTEQASDQERDQEPPRKKQKQKENVTPRTIYSSSGNAFGKQAGGSRSRTNVHSAAPHIGEDPGEDDLVEILSSPGARSKDNDSHMEVIDVDALPSGLGNKSSTLAFSHRQAPVTPKLDKRPHPMLAAASLPSPPPTAPTYKHARDVRHEESSPSHAEGRSSYPDLKHSSPHPQETDTPTSRATVAQVVGDKDAIVLRSPQRGSGMSMPPPPLPHKASSPSMPTRPALRPPLSSSSDRWVPSSQSQELSIPLLESRGDTNSSAVPHTPIGQSTQVIPSSQSHERELRITDVLHTEPDAFRTPDSPLQRCRSPVSPLLPDTGMEHDMDVLPPSPGFVESSQSQTEHELSTVWAEAIGSRQAALDRPAGVAGIPSSSPPRPAASQDYDAQDEYSQSQEGHSQASTFGHSQHPSSPFQAASQFTDASNSSSYTPYPETPPQFRDFLGMFENRDEFGNELPPPPDRLLRPPSPSPSTDQRARLHDRNATSPPSHAYGPSSSRRSEDEDAEPDLLDEILDSQLGNSQSYLEDSDYGSSSLPEVYPTPVRDFLDMFEESQQSQAGGQSP